MKRFTAVTLALVLSLLLAATAFAQSTPVIQDAQRQDAGNTCQTITAAAAAAATLTISATGSNYVYVTFLEITNYASVAETGNAAPNLVTVTGINGSPILTMGTGLAIGTVDRYQAAIGSPWKSNAPGTNVVVTTPAFAGAIWRINACFYLNPK